MFKKLKHLKIRNIFPEVYKDSKSPLSFQEWYDFEYENNFEDLWDKYIEKADEMSGDKKIVIMDTMYGVKTIKYLYSKLKQNLGVLYIFLVAIVTGILTSVPMVKNKVEYLSNKIEIKK